MAAGVPDFLNGGGEAGAILRGRDWASSALGAPDSWPDDLKSMLRTVLASDSPMSLAWGMNQVLFYNDAYAPKLGARHPDALGQPADKWLNDLVEAQARLSLTLSNAEIVGLWSWRIPEDLVFADRRFAELYSVNPDRAAAGAPIAEFVGGVHPDDRDRLGDDIARALRSGGPFMSEYRLLGADGVVRHVLARGQTTYGPDGKPAVLAGATIDISARREAELALKEREESYHALLNTIGTGFCIIEMIYDAEGRPHDYLFEEVNPAFERHTGMIDAAGKRMREFVPEHEQYWFDIYGRVAETGEPVQFEQGSGALGRWFALEAYKVGDADSRRVAVLFSDITEKKDSDLRLRASEAQFRTLAQALPDHAWTAGADGLLDWFNSRVYDYSGASPGELDGVGWTKIVHPDDVPAAAARWQASLASGDIYEAEFRLRRHDSVYRWYIARAVPSRTETGEIVRWVGTNTDIEDQKAAAKALSEMNTLLEARVEARTRELMAVEHALRQSQKMEAIGQLTGGIAHDFNNLMTGILSALTLVRRRVAAGRTSEIAPLMEAAEASANRAAALTHRLLAFARQQSLDMRIADIRDIVHGMQFLLSQTLGENIALAARFDPDLWSVRTDANQLENAILNLAINARDAMPSGGELIIHAVNHTAAAPRRDDNDLSPGDYVALSVIDSGEGMTPEVLTKAFDPFFTTKPIGQGTGLGLSMIYGFARQSGGGVKIESSPGQGTRVTLFLPRAAQAYVATPQAEPQVESAHTPREQTILVVEDDPTVRLMVVTALNDWGYRHHACKDAVEAMEVISADARIDLLLTDVGLPMIDGRRLAETARQVRPDLPVLFMTGYAQKAAMRDAFLDHDMDLLTKPFTLEDLSARIEARFSR